MKFRLIKKSLIIVIIILFVGASFLPVINAEIENKDCANQSTPAFSEGKIYIGSRNHKIYCFGSEVNQRRNIMLTGYWNPTGQMIAPFSTDTYLNPDGWIGENWEDLGYNIYSFFPNPGTYNGTFEVDYQDTLDDFVNITAEINPIAIISFGGGAGPWEIEYNARNLDSWVPDKKPPYQPTPCPPDGTVSVGYVRHSTLPVQEIEDAVNEQTSIYAWVDWDGNPGAYLCEYIAYLGMWYQAEHNSTEDPNQCLVSGFIHVNANVDLDDAMDATKITIREVIKNLPNNSPDTPTITGPPSGEPGIEYTYCIFLSDPDEDSLYVKWSWGDGTGSDWLGPFGSGIEVCASHTWNKKGTYTISVIVKDEHGASATAYKEVVMPRNKIINRPLLKIFENNPNLFSVLLKIIQRLGLQ
jgi:pyrrolidone-carboxylate peptidase